MRAWLDKARWGGPMRWPSSSVDACQSAFFVEHVIAMHRHTVSAVRDQHLEDEIGPTGTTPSTVSCAPAVAGATACLR